MGDNDGRNETTVIGFKYTNGIFLACNMGDQRPFYEIRDNLHICIIPVYKICSDQIFDEIKPQIVHIEQVEGVVAKLSKIIRDFKNFSALVADVNANGSKIYTIDDHGYRSEHEFTAVGLYGITAMSLLELKWNRSLTMNDAELIANDTISVITKTVVRRDRNYDTLSIEYKGRLKPTWNCNANNEEEDDDDEEDQRNEGLKRAKQPHTETEPMECTEEEAIENCAKSSGARKRTHPEDNDDDEEDQLNEGLKRAKQPHTETDPMEWTEASGARKRAYAENDDDDEEETNDGLRGLKQPRAEPEQE